MFLKCFVTLELVISNFCKMSVGIFSSFANKQHGSAGMRASTEIPFKDSRSSNAITLSEVEEEHDIVDQF